MFNTMTFVKTFGAFCGALLIFLLGSWFAEAVYHSGGGHGEGEHAQGYVVEVASADGAGEVVEEVPFSEILAAADPSKGERVFRKCAACHSLEPGANGVGPSLAGVVNRPVAAISDYNYSGALKPVADVWTPDTLSAFIEKPAAFAPGTAMGFAGLPKVSDRANLISYLAEAAN